MKKISIAILSTMLCVPVIASAPLSGTAGSNLTAWNGSMGEITNNQWNNLTNVRNNNGGTSNAAANFGNCNSVILRCAQPKCGSGCTSMELAVPIVQGCVLSNDECKKYGDDLIMSLSAQMVANATAKSNAAAVDAQNAATNAAAQQSAQQLQAMQQQIEQMQAQSAAAAASSAAAVQAALDEQKRLTEAAAQQQIAAAEAAAAAAAAAAPSQKIENAVKNDVSADVLVREQIGNKILSQMENAEDALKALKKTMQTVFDYAKCDANGNHCEGPGRVAVFKDKANDFFDPYNDVLDEVYDALILSQSVGVDITDIYMMLNDTCQIWGEYIYMGEQTDTKQSDGTYTNNRWNDRAGWQLVKLITDDDDNQVQAAWMNNTGSGSDVRVMCASDALDNSALFRNRKKSSNIGVELLQQIISQDSPTYFEGDAIENAAKYCYKDDITKSIIQKYIANKRYPDEVCATSDFNSAAKIDGENSLCQHYVNPVFALCSVHAYNAGKESNPTDASSRAEVQEIVAMKSNLMTLEMKRQFDYLEATVARFKTQLEKSILTSQMEAAGAASEESNYTGSALTGTQDCNRFFDTTQKFQCLSNNYNAIGYATNYGETINSSAKEQLAKDYSAAIGLGTSLNAGIATVDDSCKNKNTITDKDKFQACLTDLTVKLGTLQRALSGQNQSQGQSSNQGSGQR